LKTDPGPRKNISATKGGGKGGYQMVGVEGCWGPRRERGRG